MTTGKDHSSKTSLFDLEDGSPGLFFELEGDAETDFMTDVELEGDLEPDQAADWDLEEPLEFEDELRRGPNRPVGRSQPSGWRRPSSPRPIKRPILRAPGSYFPVAVPWPEDPAPAAWPPLAPPAAPEPPLGNDPRPDAGSATAPFASAPTDGDRLGGGNEEVRWLQDTLNRAIGAGIAITGRIDAATRNAVRRYQAKVRLPVTGYVGPDTQAALMGGRAQERLSRPGVEREANEAEEQFLSLANPPTNTAPLRVLSPVAAAPCLAVGGLVQARAQGLERNRWLQRALNRVLRARFAVDGRIGPATIGAVRRFQARQRLPVSGNIDAVTEQRLAQAARMPLPSNELELDFEDEPEIFSAATATISLASGFIQLVRSGFEVARLLDGSFKLDAPSPSLKAPQSPFGIGHNEQQARAIIVDLKEDGPFGLERINVKVACVVAYDGINLEASFRTEAGGERTRLMRDVAVRIGTPTTIEKKIAPDDWQRCGVREYVVMRLPVKVSIDMPFPIDNHEETFELVLSSMYGFGASAQDRAMRRHINSRTF
jgi:peptidoglycan hydrolase-like protein with peptidoglycan-binding domain